MHKLLPLKAALVIVLLSGLAGTHVASGVSGGAMLPLAQTNVPSDRFNVDDDLYDDDDDFPWGILGLLGLAGLAGLKRRNDDHRSVAVHHPPSGATTTRSDINNPNRPGAL